MPEIPEMELYKNNLNSKVKGKTINQVWIYRPKCVNLETDIFSHRIIGTKTSVVERKGKYLVFSLSNGLKLLAHMMLDGRLYYLSGKDSPLETSDFEEVNRIYEKVQGLSGKPSVLFLLEDQSLLFFCQLTLGYLRLYKEDELRSILDELGPDPLDVAFSSEDFSLLLAKASKRGMIKPWLMQQKNISGVGNAYSNESLFGAGMLPTRKIGSISSSERITLFSALRDILEESIKRGGDMEEPFTLNDHFTGGFIPYFRVYDKEGDPCIECGRSIVKEEVGGRNAFFCPQCQN